MTQPEKPDSTELFNPDEYDSPALKLDHVDGHKIDKISVRFSGSVDLDRNNPEHVSLFRRFAIGADVDFQDMPPLSGYVSSKPPRSVRSGDGYRADVAQAAVITITDIGGFGAPAPDDDEGTEE
jgi:hypothetical protein